MRRKITLLQTIQKIFLWRENQKKKRALYCTQQGLGQTQNNREGCSRRTPLLSESGPTFLDEKKTPTVSRGLPQFRAQDVSSYLELKKDSRKSELSLECLPECVQAIHHLLSSTGPLMRVCVWAWHARVFLGVPISLVEYCLKPLVDEHLPLSRLVGL